MTASMTGEPGDRGLYHDDMAALTRLMLERWQSLSCTLK
jgi:hypothetical protein